MRISHTFDTINKLQTEAEKMLEELEPILVVEDSNDYYPYDDIAGKIEQAISEIDDFCQEYKMDPVMYNNFMEYLHALREAKEHTDTLGMIQNDIRGNNEGYSFHIKEADSLRENLHQSDDEELVGKIEDICSTLESAKHCHEERMESEGNFNNTYSEAMNSISEAINIYERIRKSFD